MKKDSRLVEALVDLINEYVDIENTISSLPCGYVSTKTISNKTYFYRQWREGSKISSVYIPSALVNGIKRKIAFRKENEALLKEVKKDLAKTTRKVVKAGLMTDEDVSFLLQAGRDGKDVATEAAKIVK